MNEQFITRSIFIILLVVGNYTVVISFHLQIKMYFFSEKKKILLYLQVGN